MRLPWADDWPMLSCGIVPRLWLKAMLLNYVNYIHCSCKRLCNRSEQLWQNGTWQVDQSSSKTGPSILHECT